MSNRVVVFMSLVSAVLLCACGGGSTSNGGANSNQSLAIYGLNIWSPSVDAYQANTTSGSLSLVGATAAMPNRPIAAVPSENGKFLYVLDTDQLTIFNIATDGSLTLNNRFGANPPLPTGTQAMTRVGERIYAAGMRTLAVYQIDESTGALARLVTADFTTLATAVAIAVDSQGKYIYVAHQQLGAGAAPLSSFSYNSSTATLTEISGSPYLQLQGPIRSLAVDPNERFLFVNTAGQLGAPPNDAIVTFSIGSNGALTLAGSVATDFGTTIIRVHPTAPVLYVAAYSNGNSYTPALKTYQYSATGVVTATGQVQTLNAGYSDVSVDPAGEFVVLAPQRTGSYPYAIETFKTNVSGALTPAAATIFGASAQYFAVAAVRH